MTPSEARTLTLDDLVERGGQAGSTANSIIEIELMRRQTIAEQAASDAQIDAADHAKRNATYMLWSVVVLAVSSAASLVLQIMTYVRAPH